MKAKHIFVVGGYICCVFELLSFIFFSNEIGNLFLIICKRECLEQLQNEKNPGAWILVEKILNPARVQVRNPSTWIFLIFFFSIFQTKPRIKTDDIKERKNEK
jgi:hypothetical protein